MRGEARAILPPPGIKPRVLITLATCRGWRILPGWSSLTLDSSWRRGRDWLRVAAGLCPNPSGLPVRPKGPHRTQGFSPSTGGNGEGRPGLLEFLLEMIEQTVIWRHFYL